MVCIRGIRTESKIRSLTNIDFNSENLSMQKNLSKIENWWLRRPPEFMQFAYCLHILQYYLVQIDFVRLNLLIEAKNHKKIMPVNFFA